VSKDKALEELKVLNEAKAKIEEEFRIKSTEEELAELKRRINLRDKYLQLGMNRPELINEDTVNNLFPDLKDKSYVQVLEEKRKAYLGLIEAQKATEQTTKDLIFIENELKNAKGVETFMQGVNDRISELKERYKGAELIDKLKKAKSLQLGGTEEENLERNKAYASALKEAQKDYDKFYRDLLEQQKTYEEKSLELQKEYAALKATERYKNASEEEQKKIEQAFSKRAIDLFFEEMAKKEEWAKMFADMNLVASSKLEEFKNILQQKLTEAKTIEEKIKIGEFIKKIDDTLRDRNPFKSLIKAISDLGDKSLSTEEKILRLTQAIDKSKSYLNDVKGVVSDVRGAFDDLGISTDNTFGDILSNVEQSLEGLNQMADGVMTFAQGFATKNPVQMVVGAIKTIGGLIKTVSGWLNGDNKRERNIKRWAQALEEVKEQYRALEHQISKTLGENIYKEQGKIIANLRQQQQMLQRMANEEAGKKKSDSGKIAEYRNQANEIDRQITDIIDKMKNDIAQTDAKSLADKMGDALFEAWQRGEDGVRAYGKTVDDVMRNAVKAILKQKLLEEPMQKLINNLVSKLGFGKDTSDLEKQIKEAEERFKRHNGRTVSFEELKKIQEEYAEIEKLKAQLRNAQTEIANGSLADLTKEQAEEIKNKFRSDVDGLMKGFDRYKDILGLAEENADSLKGGIKGMSEETAGILAGQFNAIRIHTAEIQKNQGFGLDIAKSSLMNLTKIEENTRNLYQMRKDLSEMNAKIKSNDTRGLGL
ncbi:phage tail protein, partial [Riemerella anatipestifer]|nr:phage tail protein [Riemerella anatipestifer]